MIALSTITLIVVVGLHFYFLNEYLEQIKQEILNAIKDQHEPPAKPAQD